jgi:hypothetical protein
MKRRIQEVENALPPLRAKFKAAPKEPVDSTEPLKWTPELLMEMRKLEYVMERNGYVPIEEATHYMDPKSNNFWPSAKALAFVPFATLITGADALLPEGLKFLRVLRDPVTDEPVYLTKRAEYPVNKDDPPWGTLTVTEEGKRYWAMYRDAYKALPEPMKQPPYNLTKEQALEIEEKEKLKQKYTKQGPNEQSGGMGGPG